MTTLGSIGGKRSGETYENVMALFTTLQDGRNSLRSRRAELNMNNEVPAEALDFLLDVEIKAKRALSSVEYPMFLRLAEEGNYNLLPEELKLTLGNVWSERKMGIDGDYRSLYFRVKNAQERERLTEAVNGTRDVEPEQFD
jgi:hypothetical protein